MILSPTQAAALSHLEKSGGFLQRWPGGYWTTEQIPANPGHSRRPAWWIGTRTVVALERLGLIRARNPEQPWHRRHFELTRRTI